MGLVNHQRQKKRSSYVCLSVLVPNGILEVIITWRQHQFGRQIFLTPCCWCGVSQKTYKTHYRWRDRFAKRGPWWNTPLLIQGSASFKLKVMTAVAVKLHAPRVRTPIPTAGEEKVISQHQSSPLLYNAQGLKSTFIWLTQITSWWSLGKASLFLQHFWKQSNSKCLM